MSRRYCESAPRGAQKVLLGHAAYTPMVACCQYNSCPKRLSRREKTAVALLAANKCKSEAIILTCYLVTHRNG